MSAVTQLPEHTELILDGTKIAWHLDRVAQWERGERIAPITIDMALTRACNYACQFCYAMLQENDRQVITRDVIYRFLDDCAELGVKGISFVSDGESTISPVFADAVRRGSELGLSMAVGTNGLALTAARLPELLPYLTYLRVNISAGERARYAQIMGVKESWFDQVCQNIADMVAYKRAEGLPVTIGMQMVVMPSYQDQILPLARLGQKLRPDYLVLKHCSDNEDGDLGVVYADYERIHETLRAAEALSDGDYRVVVKWSKIADQGQRRYQRCYGPPFMLQISGSGLVAPCGMLFNERYKKFHMGNICQQSFKEIWSSDRYWEVMSYLGGPSFNAQKMCGSLCLQHKVNEVLDDYQKGLIELRRPAGEPPAHLAFL
jgi:MoaA/NifB/PqqE/SkfB family radical SAM enzyme